MISKLKGIFSVVQMSVTTSIIIILMYFFRKKTIVFRRLWSSMQLKLLGIKLNIVGELDTTANMVIMNHQSMLDIIVLEHLHPKNLAWVAKKEIANIPWFGNVLRLPEMIIVERESKSSLVKLIKDTKDRLSKGRPIAIFPEGTRSNGDKIRKFKAGTKMIANKYNLKVQPVVLIGTRDILDTQNLKQQGGEVKIIYLPTIEAKKGTDWYETVEANMRETFNKEIKSDI